MKDPDYYDSQGSAAAALGLTVYDLRDAKAQGCKAFRSGRVYRLELLAWFEKHPAPRSRVPNSPAPNEESEWFNAQVKDWDDRMALLFEVGEFLDFAFSRKQISAAEYRKIGTKTLRIILQLNDAWKAGIDKAGYMKRWARTLLKLPQ